jgi:hypothetical protein
MKLMNKKLLLAAVLGLALVLVVGGAVFAQTANPPAANTPATPQTGQTPPAILRGLGLPGGNWKAFDAAAAALKLTPTQLFEQLHSGKTLAQVAQAQGVDLKTVQQAIRSAQVASAEQALARAVAAGRITQAQADWITTGINNGWFRGTIAAYLRGLLR